MRNVPRDETTRSLWLQRLVERAQTAVNHRTTNRWAADETGSVGDLVERAVPRVRLRTAALEWAVIFVVVLAFCLPFLDLGSGRALRGNEAGIVQSLDWTLVNAVREHGTFPLWNPYLQTGLPFVADPFLHAYNPLATVPVLLFGVDDGFRVALFLSFLAAAYGMWLGGLVLGLRPVSRVWLALMYAFTGQAVARFFQGEYDFVLGYAWIPWALGAAVAAVRSGRLRWITLAAASLALVFFSGNVYYAFYTAVAMALFTVVAAVGVGRVAPSTGGEPTGAASRAPAQDAVTGGEPAGAVSRAPAQDASSSGGVRVTVHWRRVRVLALIALLALGLAAIQILPLVEFWPHLIKHGSDPQLRGSHSLAQILADYLSRDPWRPDAIGVLPPEEFYAYTGIWPFLLLLPLPWAVRRLRRERGAIWPVVFIAALILLAFAWINSRAMPWAGLYARSEFLNQFRYPTRMLIFGAFGLLALAGLGLDWMWQAVRDRGGNEFRLSVPGLARWLVGRVGLLLVIVFVVVSVGDVFSANRQHTVTRDRYAPEHDLPRWLAQNVSGVYYTGTQNNWHNTLVANDLRYSDAWYGFFFYPPRANGLNLRQVEARPNYQILGNDRAPDLPDAELVRAFDTHMVWYLPHSLPFAFGVSRAALNDVAAGRELWREDVAPIEPSAVDPNRIELVADGPSDSLLVVLTAAFRGWGLTMDGEPARLVNVGGYLAAELRAGPHTYVFTHSPASFWAGLVISLVTVCILAGLLIADARRDRRVRRRIVRADAVYEDGVLRPREPLALEEGAAVRLTVVPLPGGTVGPSVGADRPQPQGDRPRPAETWPRPAAGSGLSADADRLRVTAGRNPRLEGALFVLALAVYLFTRLYALDRFPIYFFSDEAIHTTFAEELIANDFKNAQGLSFPFYFEVAGNRWMPLISVYAHVASITLAGKSLIANRATSALASVLAAIAVALILRKVFKARYWWMGPLLLVLAPAWFLHSRTDFETLMMSAFYACFLLSYLLYRTQNPRYLLAATLFGAATFYTYSNGQMIMAVAGVLLLLSDLPYHVKHWRMVLAAVLLVGLLAVPLLRFRATQPDFTTTHLRTIGSYWMEPKPLSDKLVQFAKTYSYGLSPAYWFIPNEHDLIRHRMKGYGHLALPFLPFFLIGVGVSLRRIRSAPHRAVLLAALAAPAGAVLVDVLITRVLAFIVPATILIGLGLEAVLVWGLRALGAAPSTGASSFGVWSRPPAQDASLSEGDGEPSGVVRRPPARDAAVWTGISIALFLVLSGASLWMLRDALVNGPVWYNNYGLYGMQYGAKQLFEEAIPELLAQDPNNRIMLTSTWANGTDVFMRFFLSPEQYARVQMFNIDYYMSERRPLDANTILVMTADEYQRAVTSPKFSRVDVERLIPYPDGSPGFYFVRLEYSPNFDALLAPERESRVRPVEGQVMVDGQVVSIEHSPLDMGQLADLFDGEPFTLVRGLAANPLVFDFTFPQSRSVKGLSADFGTMDFTLTVKLYTDAAGEPVVYTEEYRNMPPDPHVDMQFPGAPDAITRVRIEVEQLNAAPEVHTHVREFSFR